VPARRPGRPRGGARREWVGGRLTSRFVIAEPAPHRPDVFLWLLLPDDFLLHASFDDPDAPVAFAETLHAAFENSGPRPQPTPVRVASAGLAAALERAHGAAIEVTVAPTPELDTALAELEAIGESQIAPTGRRGDFDPTRMDLALWRQLYEHAARFFALAPWRFASNLPMRIDVPALGVEGACLCLVGDVGHARGFLIFPSLALFEHFFARAPALTLAPDAPLEVGGETLLLELVAKSKLRAPQRREAERGRWRAPARGANPVVECRDSDGAPLPVRARDLELVVACTEALVSLFSDFAS